MYKERNKIVGQWLLCKHTFNKKGHIWPLFSSCYVQETHEMKGTDKAKVICKHVEKPQKQAKQARLLPALLQAGIEGKQSPTRPSPNFCIRQTPWAGKSCWWACSLDPIPEFPRESISCQPYSCNGSQGTTYTNNKERNYKLSNEEKRQCLILVVWARYAREITVRYCCLTGDIGAMQSHNVQNV